jgi:hypothetical protein
MASDRFRTARRRQADKNFCISIFTISINSVCEKAQFALKCEISATNGQFPGKLHIAIKFRPGFKIDSKNFPIGLS